MTPANALASIFNFERPNVSFNILYQIQNTLNIELMKATEKNVLYNI